MKTAEYPQRKCRQPVSGEWQDYPCEIREWHLGPCASQSVAASVRLRDDWERAHPDDADKARDPMEGISGAG